MKVKYNQNNITVVKLSGTPGEIGYNNGLLCKEEIKEAVNILYLSFEDSSQELLDYYIQKSNILEKKLPEEYREEIQGISEGSGIDYKKILLHNMAMTIDEGQRCFAFSCYDHEDKILTLRNLDHSASSKFYKKMILYAIKPQKGYGLVVLSIPGIVDSETGINEKGITITQNNIRVKQTEWNVMPISALTRKLIQYSDSIDQVENDLNSEKFYPARLIFCSSPTKASFFEIANTEKERVNISKRYLALSNHATKIDSKYIVDESLERLDYASNFLSKHYNMSYTTILELARSPLISRSHSKSKNWQSVLFSPSKLELWIAESLVQNTHRSACHNKYIGFNVMNLLYNSEKKIDPVYFPSIEENE